MFEGATTRRAGGESGRRRGKRQGGGWDRWSQEEEGFASLLLLWFWLGFWLASVRLVCLFHLVIGRTRHNRTG